MNPQAKVYETPQVIYEGNISVRAGTPPVTRGESNGINLFDNE